jgi:hypothetical protein
VTEEWIERVSKVLFGQEHGGANWDGQNKRDWMKAVTGIVVALENGVPREEIAGAAARAYDPIYNKATYHDDWERFTTFVVAEYLLTPRETK